MKASIGNAVRPSSAKKLLAILAVILLVGIFIAIERGRSPSMPSSTPASAQDIALNKAKAARMNDAMDLCESAVSSAATNRSSVKFLGLTDGARVRQDGAGQMIVTIRFSAKNSYGSESVGTARCVISDDGKTLVDMTTQDSR